MTSPMSERLALTPVNRMPTSASGRDSSSRTPLTNEVIWKRLREAGFDEDSIKRRDKAELIYFNVFLCNAWPDLSFFLTHRQFDQCRSLKSLFSNINEDKDRGWMSRFVHIRTSDLIPAERMPFPKECNIKPVPWFPSAVSDLTETAQRLQDKNEEGEDDGCLLVARKRRSTNASKTTEPMVAGAVQSLIEEILEGSSSKVPKPSGGKSVSRLGEHLVGELEEPNFETLQRKNNILSESLGIINVDDLSKGQVFSEVQFRDAQAMRTPNVGTTHEGSDIFWECLAGIEDGPDPDASFIFDEVENLLKQEESLAWSCKIEELEAKSAVELAKAKSEVEASVSSYRDDAEASNTRVEKISIAAEVKLSCALNHAIRQTRRETLDEVHARGFDLSADIEKAKTLEEEAAALLSDDEDSASGYESGGDEDEVPKGEVPEDAAPDDAAPENVASEDVVPGDVAPK
uniref:Protein CROWDED NUCLEI 4-like n=1 Tax=Nicotiana tabacum TaxID=4097 RepID=A0A1S4BYQ1_TOBAC|nr:PREDICTED: protein CROWDED NUCLEI 4-like [Nicotiana tabacum]